MNALLVIFTVMGGAAQTTTPYQSMVVCNQAAEAAAENAKRHLGEMVISAYCLPYDGPIRP